MHILLLFFVRKSLFNDVTIIVMIRMAYKNNIFTKHKKKETQKFKFRSVLATLNLSKMGRHVYC